jgi:hypothetical protein
MSFGLLFPAALAALAALVLPLVIHIARKSEQQPTDFAALRWLRQKPKPRSRLRFDEWPLLLLRLLLIALAALWLAQPVLFGGGSSTPYVAVIAGAQVDAAALEGRRVHWLAPGFPAFDEARPTGPLPVSSLLRELDASLPAGTPLTIIAPSTLAGADAARVRLSRPVTWRVTPGQMPTPAVVLPAPPRLAVRYDSAHRPALRYIRAAASAWQQVGKAADMDVAAAGAPLPKRDRALFWLVGGTVPADVVEWARSGGTLFVPSDALLPNQQHSVVTWRGPQGESLGEALRIGKGRLLRFSRPLDPARMPALLEPDFPDGLRAMLSQPPPPRMVRAADYAPLGGARPYDQAPIPLRSWVAVLIALVLCIERWLATSRRRSVAP